MQPLFLAAIGVRTCLGTGLTLHHEKLASERSRFRRQRHYLGSDFAPQVTAFDGEIDAQSFAERALALGRDAIGDLRSARGSADAPVINRLVIVLPEPGAEPGLCHDDLRQVGDRLGDLACISLQIEPESRDVQTMGASGLALALRDFAHKGEGEGDLLILAVDSYRDRGRLNGLIARRRMFSSRDRFGFIPGEAAVATLVTMKPAAPPLARITGIGMEIEPVREFDDGVTDHAALTRACAAALPADEPVACWITDWNNSRYRATELSYTELRLRRRLDVSAEIRHAPLIFGETGAASLGVAMLMGLQEPSCLLTASVASTGDRTAIALAERAAAGFVDTKIRS